MNTKHKPGLLFAIDGIDGAGKTTQVIALKEVLEKSGLEVVCSKEPTEGIHGMKLRQSAHDGRHSLEDELALFIADRKEHVQTKIRPALETGKVVILDRYFYSTLAYQGARGADLKSIESEVLDTPIPDKTFILDLPPAVAVSRIRDGRNETPNEFENEDYLGKVREIFQAMQFDEMKVIDSTMPPSLITKAILDELIETSFRDHYCRKSYGCDELVCFARISKTCKWAEIQKGIADRIDQAYAS